MVVRRGSMVAKVHLYEVVHEIGIWRKTIIRVDRLFNNLR